MEKKPNKFKHYLSTNPALQKGLEVKSHQKNVTTSKKKKPKGIKKQKTKTQNWAERWLSG